MERGKKLLTAAAVTCTTWVLMAPAAFADANESDDDMKRGGFAVLVIVIIAAIWFFVFRGKEDDTGADAPSEDA